MCLASAAAVLMLATVPASAADRKTEMMMALSYAGAYESVCHKELSPAAQRGFDVSATISGIGNEDDRKKIGLGIQMVIQHHKEHPEQVAKFCEDMNGILTPLENLGNGPLGRK